MSSLAVKVSTRGPGLRVSLNFPGCMLRLGV